MYATADGRTADRNTRALFARKYTDKGKNHERPQTAAKKKDEIKKLKKEGLNKSQIARKLKISRGSVIAFLK